MHNKAMCMLLRRGYMPAHSHVFAIRPDSTEDRIERALANGPMTLKALAEQLQLSVNTIRNCMPYTDAIQVGLERVRTGRPWVRYALPDWKPAPGEQETVGFNHVESVEEAIALQPMTVLQLSRHLSLSESTIRTVLPNTRAVVLMRYKPSRRRKGRAPVVYGLPAEAARGTLPHHTMEPVNDH